ncbi:MAG: hypothetical protein WCK34_02405, partial [Bacteroidota bacterium]
RPPERTAPPVQQAQPRQQDRNSGFNRQEMERQNQARQRGTQNTNNRSNVQQAAPAGNNGGTRSGGKSDGRDGRKR